jgi:hypothetical protein
MLAALFERWSREKWRRRRHRHSTAPKVELDAAQTQEARVYEIIKKTKSEEKDRGTENVEGEEREKEGSESLCEK